MIPKHQIKGSTKPPLVEGKLRLYAMHFCPFALRTRLILLIKQVPHDIVNIHLRNKPDWYFEVNPKGLIPTLDTGSQIIPESLDICDYLDEQFPNPPLYPADETKRSQDKELLKQYNAITSTFVNTFCNRDDTTLAEHLEVLNPLVQKYEEELKNRGSVFFGGDKPGMVDYMIWPWVPCAYALELVYDEKLPGEKEYPHLYAWCKAMRGVKVIKDTIIEVERLAKLSRQYSAGPQAVDYDNI